MSKNITALFSDSTYRSLLRQLETLVSLVTESQQEIFS